MAWTHYTASLHVLKLKDCTVSDQIYALQVFFSADLCSRERTACVIDAVITARKKRTIFRVCCVLRNGNAGFFFLTQAVWFSAMLADCGTATTEIK